MIAMLVVVSVVAEPAFKITSLVERYSASYLISVVFKTISVTGRPNSTLPARMVCRAASVEGRLFSRLNIP